jgi:ribosome-binding protein aMBF1 (putative translation factor)
MQANEQQYPVPPKPHACECCGKPVYHPTQLVNGASRYFCESCLRDMEREYRQHNRTMARYA